MIPVYCKMFSTVFFVSLFAISQLNVNTVSGNLDIKEHIRRLKEPDFIEQDPLIRKQIIQIWDVTQSDVATIKRFNKTCITVKYSRPDFRAEGRRISEVKCLEYMWNVRYDIDERKNESRCITSVPFVLGGKDAEIGELPDTGAIGWSGISPGTWIFKCGGVLISSKYVLTVAHCSRVSRTDTTVSDPFPKIVRFGAINISDRDKYGAPPKEVKISKFIVHDKYRAPKTYYDIALIELETELEFSRKIHPSCVWTSASDITGKATVSGWGVVDTGSLVEVDKCDSGMFYMYDHIKGDHIVCDTATTRQTSATLQIATVGMVPSEQCSKTLETKWNRNWRKGLASHQICAGHAEGGIDSCQGDSGGPLQVTIIKNMELRMHYVIGVTSFGYGCGQANTPSVYTRVASFIDWIEDVVWKKEFN